MFYSPAFLNLEETFQRQTGQQEKVVVIPSYHNWFIAAWPRTAFISEWKRLFEVYLILDHEIVLDSFNRQGLTVDNYFESAEAYSEWTCKMTLAIKQKYLDKTSTTGRQYAVN